MQQLANQRSSAAKTEADFIKRQLETDFANATEEALVLQARLQSLREESRRSRRGSGAGPARARRASGERRLDQTAPRRNSEKTRPTSSNPKDPRGNETRQPHNQESRPWPTKSRLPTKRPWSAGRARGKARHPRKRGRPRQDPGGPPQSPQAHRLNTKPSPAWPKPAPGHLASFSQNRYTLRLGSGTEEATARAEQDFFVVDAWNGDSIRSVRTLSGGETFLASLALALALAESLAELGAESRATDALESLFLDEGFGTLDSDTLDVVVGALDTLHGGDRMVGIVTHVRELAERLPARLEVGRAGTTATVRVQ